MRRDRKIRENMQKSLGLRRGDALGEGGTRGGGMRCVCVGGVGVWVRNCKNIQ